MNVNPYTESRADTHEQTDWWTNNPTSF